MAETPPAPPHSVTPGNGMAASPWSPWMWWLIGAFAAIDAAWLAFGQASLSFQSLPQLLRIACLVGLLCWLARRCPDRARLHTVLTGSAMLAAAWPALRLFNHLSMSLGMPLADATLARADALIGFDWLAYLLWLDAHPPIVRMMGLTYSGLTGYSAALFVILAAGRQPARHCAEFVKLFLLTACVCMVIGLFFPALAAIIHYHPDPALFSYIRGQPGAYHLAALTTLRTDPAPVLDLSNLPGLVTFPSFHTAMGVVAIYCARHTPVLFGLSLAVNLTMIGSTPLFGAHYGIDILGGTLVASGAIFALRQTSARRAARPLERIEPARA